ncbi:Uncharacterized conserved protein, DUF305 family [Thermomonospora echinospora]|uniref:Uncharacterized conserved protein, DUF305 family n=1 Tax=Thermomonospora echinospora TaxID=1992 RepID=A0A1H6BGV8_9ACTN|nr:DUF305 domain-containing protein [Thermomonospora echinospora]SEG59999.1 Uncharacterized conserved protein, DUF305 family [Thermomonospora echinospora]
MSGQRWAGLGIAFALVSGLLVGCSGEEEPAAAPKATVIAPGRPGEPNKTITAGPTSAKPPTAAEITFVQMMIPHHQQALEMSVLAPKQASDAKVKSLAERIDVSQGAEISVMQSWLRRQPGGRPGGGHGGHGGHGAPSAAASHAGMPGMATPEEMARLQAAQGEEFDRLYLTLMIKHHEGALTMANDVLSKDGTDVTVQELAKDVLTTQRAEIVRMRDLLRE